MSLCWGDAPQASGRRGGLGRRFARQLSGRPFVVEPTVVRDWCPLHFEDARKS
jgi:hypothetical protein